jgi:hypothetical protein
MDWTSMWNNVGDQGTLFWSATGAVALGMTLILCAGILHLQRWRHGSVVKKSSIPVTRSGAEPAAKPATQDVSAPPVPNHAETNDRRAATAEIPDFSAGTVSAERMAQSSEMVLLLARLHSAADRLEDYRQKNRQNPVSTGESPLKESLDGVDYLFRTGTA